MQKYFRKKSGINNLGLFAKGDIKKGEKVIEYKGRKFTHKQVEEDDRFDNSKAIYLFTLNERYVLDGDTKINTAKYINHSCDPNCGILDNINIVTLRHIKSNEEIIKVLLDELDLLYDDEANQQYDESTTYITDWGNNPYIKGVKSYPLVSGTGAAEEYAKPINNRLYIRTMVTKKDNQGAIFTFYI